MTSTAAVPETVSIGGLRTFFAPVDGPVHVALSFRVGTADETLATHGVTHLVEHLVLAALGQPTFSWNGVTTAERTVFFCEGTAEQAAWFLDGVATNICRPPLTHLDVERRLLRAEAGHRSSGLQGLHDIWRWGTQGHGIAAYEEFGLAHLTPEMVSDWAARFLTAENACMWTTGQPPEDLVLPHGEFRPAPKPSTWRATSLPGYFPADVQTVSFSAELHEGQWAGVVAEILDQRLMARLRYTDGLTYGVHTDVVTVAGEGRRLIVSIDGLPDTLDSVARGATEVVATLAQEGPTADELQMFLTRYDQAMSVPEAVIGHMMRMVDSTLDDRPTRSPQWLREELEALTAEHVRNSVAAMGSSMLWCVPPDIEVPGVPKVPLGSEHRIRGLRFTPPAGQWQNSYVDVSDEGISFVDERFGPLATTILWPDCTAAVGYDDGSRLLFGRDGFFVVLYPERWARFDELRAYIDRRLPPGSWAPQGPAPERARPTPVRIDEAPTSSAVWILLSVALWIVALVFVAASVERGFDAAQFSVGVVAAVLAALLVVYVVRRGRRVKAGFESMETKRYRGIIVWPTWLVGTVLVASVGAVIAVFAIVRAWGILIGGGVAAFACGRELLRRHQRR